MADFLLADGPYTRARARPPSQSAVAAARLTAPPLASSAPSAPPTFASNPPHAELGSWLRATLPGGGAAAPKAAPPAKKPSRAPRGAAAAGAAAESGEPGPLDAIDLWQASARRSRCHCCLDLARRWSACGAPG